MKCESIKNEKEIIVANNNGVAGIKCNHDAKYFIEGNDEGIEYKLNCCGIHARHFLTDPTAKKIVKLEA